MSRLIAKAFKQGYAIVEDRLLEHPAVLDCLADGLDMAGLHVHKIWKDAVTHLAPLLSATRS